MRPLFLFPLLLLTLRPQLVAASAFTIDEWDLTVGVLGLGEVATEVDGDEFTSVQTPFIDSHQVMGVTGAESLSGAANIFLGQTEAPLLVAPYIPKMTRSELMALMTGGFATVAAGVLGSYVAILSDIDLGTGEPGGMTRHLLAACVMSAPGAFVVAKIM